MSEENKRFKTLADVPKASPHAYYSRLNTLGRLLEEATVVEIVDLINKHKLSAEVVDIGNQLQKNV